MCEAPKKRIKAISETLEDKAKEKLRKSESGKKTNC